VPSGTRWLATERALRRLVVPCVAIIFAAGAASGGDDTTRTSSVFAPVSAPADAAYTAAMLVLAITAGIAVVVGGLLAYSIVAFRHRPDDDGSEPPQVDGSGPVEFAWTAVPVLIVFVLILTTARSVYTVQAARIGDETVLTLESADVAHSFWVPRLVPGVIAGPAPTDFNFDSEGSAAATVPASGNERGGRGVAPAAPHADGR